MKKVLTIIACLAVPLIVGSISGYLTQGETSGEWYAQLQKPWFQPPGWVFGPVWTTLYTLMGISLYLVWCAPPSRARTWGLTAFGVHLVLNFFWSLIFFRWHNLGLASIEIVVLLATIITMIVLFARVKPIAAYLQIPYAAWTTFATILTITITWLNRD